MAIDPEDESCRILTISLTIEGALGFIEHVKSLAGTRIPLVSRSPQPNHLPVPLTIPWTIVNRYYIADVHFSAWTVDRVFPHLLVKPPAIIFVWSEGEPFVKHIKEIARLMKLREYEPEVALAVRIPGNASPMSDSPVIENGDIDSVLISYGFEYVDATRVPDEQGRSMRHGVNDDIPTLPRVLDALSTVMWPSMRNNKLGVSSTRETLASNRSFDGFGDEEEDVQRETKIMIQGLLRDVKENGLGLSPFYEEREIPLEGGLKVDDADRELLEQMKAIVVDAQKNNPWVSASSTADTGLELTSSPTDYDGREPFGLTLTDGGADKKITLGFEDDFSVFIRAPALQEGEDKPLKYTISDSNGLLAPDDSFGYQTLDSVSDFGEEDDTGGGGVGEEDGMPTAKEIKDTAGQIFGGGAKGENSESQVAFDLDRVFGVLQEYKAEIAGMKNGDERRKAAARVALGLAYGLEGV